MKAIQILFTLLLISCRLLSQTPTYYFKNYQVSNGVSSNTITSIVQDKKGFMWFGSRNGLNRFDGNTFKIFQNKLSDSASIGSNSIFSLFKDKQDQIWVGTYQGIYIYNPVKETFSRFRLITPAEVRHIQEDKDENIWIVSNLTLYKYNQTTKKVYSYPISGSQTVSLHISRDGSIWAASSLGVVSKYEANSDQFKSYNIPELYHRKVPPINALHSLADTAIIIGTVNGALHLNLKSLRVRNLFAGQQGINDVHVHNIFQQSQNELWLGTEGGLYIYNIKSNNIAIVGKELSNLYSLTDNVVSSIYKDIEGGTWVGTYFGGINYYSRQYNNFHKYFPEPGKNSLGGNLIHEICKDKNGNLWIGAEDAGLNRMDPKTGIIKNFLPDKKRGSISYRNIHGLVADGDELWIGTLEHGLDVMDLRTNKVVRHYNAGSNSGSFK